MSLLQLELIKLRLPCNATLVAFNHNLEILAYTYYSPTRKVYYVVIESLNPIRLCFRKKLTSLHWIYIDNRDILITSFESGYIGCFDTDGRLLFKQQIDSKPILNIYLHSSHREINTSTCINKNIPNLLCLQSNGVILITSYDLYSTLKYSNFDISLLTQQQRKEYYAQIEYDKKKQQNKLKQQTHLKYSRSLHNTSKKYHTNNKSNRRFTFDDNRDNNNNNTNTNTNISPRVLISPLPDDKEYNDLLPSTFYQYEKLKSQHNGTSNGEPTPEICISPTSPKSTRSTPTSPNSPNTFSSSSSISVNDEVKYNKYNKYNKYYSGINSIPTTTILPLRPICNKILYWNAKKVFISNEQKLTCLAACFFPVSEKSLCTENKNKIDMDENVLIPRPHPGFNLKLSTNPSSSGNLIQINNNFNHKKRSQSVSNLYVNNNNNIKQQYKYNNNLYDLINPQISFKNNKDESWLLLLCGSNPMIGAIHIEITQQKNIKTNDKTSQSMTTWFTNAAKSLFLNKKTKTNNNNNSNTLDVNTNNTNTNNINNIGPSPSKSPRALNNNNNSNTEHRDKEINKLKNKNKNKKKKNRDQILATQKHTQHTIRDSKYNKYLTNFELSNDKFYNKKSNVNNDVSITDIVMSPDSEYGAFTDSFGRIWIWDCKQCQFVRLFKGYRRAQIAWCYINNDIQKLTAKKQNYATDISTPVNKNNNNNKFDVNKVVLALNDTIAMEQTNIYLSIPSYIYRRSILLLVLYIESRGLLEFHSINCYKRLYAVNIFKKATMIYHLNYSVSPPWSNILFVKSSGIKNNSNIKNKIYKLNIDSNIIYNNCNKNQLKDIKLRKMNDIWDKKNLNSNSPIKILSNEEIYFNGNYSQRFSIFGTQYISPINNINTKEIEGDDNNNIIQWFILINKCDGDICIGLQLINKNNILLNDKNCMDDFANQINGWGYHCDGFLKHNASFSRYGWKYGKYDTIGIILNIKTTTLKFSLNGKLCCIDNGLKLPNISNNNSIYRLAVSVGLNSVAQLTIIGFCK